MRRLFLRITQHPAESIVGFQQIALYIHDVDAVYRCLKQCLVTSQQPPGFTLSPFQFKGALFHQILQPRIGPANIVLPLQQLGLHDAKCIGKAAGFAAAVLRQRYLMITGGDFILAARFEAKGSRFAEPSTINAFIPSFPSGINRA